MTAAPDRIVTVSTVRDTVPNVHRFVRRNLASGVDHMIVFLDEKQPDVRRLLDSNPHVSAVPTANGYWFGHKPKKVERRQRTSANIANAVLTSVPSVRWLFHIDADEAMTFDRSALLRSDARAVRFLTLEAVARRDWPDDGPRLFKKRPTRPQLRELAAMGTISEPRLRSYLRGHWVGKSGIRPSLGLRFRLHGPTDASGNRVEVEIPPDAHLLHYESWCLDDFVVRWRDFGPKKAERSSHRASRKRLGRAAYAIVSDPALDDEAKREELGKLFDDRVADDVEALERLDLLVEPPPFTRQPHPLPDEDRRTLGALLAALRSAPDKRPFLPEAEPDAPVLALEAIADQLDTELSDHVRRTIADHRNLDTMGSAGHASPPLSTMPRS